MAVDTINLVDGALMREYETQIMRYDVTEDDLILCAGQHVYQIAKEHCAHKRVLVLCGPGKNGCDGFVVASSLRGDGVDVTVASLRFGPEDRVASYDDVWEGARVACDVEAIIASGAYDVVIDALFGSGLNDDISEGVARIFRALQDCFIVAVDVPTGIDVDTGAVCGSALKADITVTFGFAKVGHYLYPGYFYTGKLVVADIDQDKRAIIASNIRLNQMDLWVSFFPRVHIHDHKYSRGLALIIGGSDMIGASILASKSAQRMGAGMIWLASRPSSSFYYRISLPSVVVKEFHHTGALQEYVGNASVSACLIGQGLDDDMMAKESVLMALRTCKRLVLDGTALMHVRQAKDLLEAHACEILVLTPHEGEFVRLFPEYQDLSKICKAQEAARRLRAYVVLKGADTVIASPHGDVIINAHASKYLSIAGTGDVLSGMIVSLLACGMPAMEACACAVWLHGDIAQRLGFGMVAEDMPAMMQMVMQSLLAV